MVNLYIKSAARGKELFAIVENKKRADEIIEYLMINDIDTTNKMRRIVSKFLEIEEYVEKLFPYRSFSYSSFSLVD